jgi:threonine dehydrogenase-like Zn-dependent dehydrogenase/proteasome lid subunit RPN8/RPN11
MPRSAAVTTEVHGHLEEHLLRTDGQEDLCFAVWHPSRGRERLSALVKKVVLPKDGERHVHGTASFESAYFLRAAEVARAEGGGLAFLHSHPDGLSWQGMSEPDIETESAHAPRAMAITGLPLVGLTMAGDGALSGRFWERTEKRAYRRFECENIRVVGGQLQASWNPHLRPVPATTEAQLRTVSAWGELVQADLARLKVGVIGAGSVGAMVGEALTRSGVERIFLLDFDTVEVRNLDRLIHATMLDALLHRTKVHTLGRALERSASAAAPQIETLELSVVEESGFRAALDCDVLFSCVDRPWPRAALNYIALAHLIPVVDAGIHIKRKSDGGLRMASWRAHVAAPGRRCLECLGQFTSGFVTVEKDGSLDDPSYIAALPTDHPLAARQNVFAFSQAAAAQAMEQYLRMVVSPGGLADVGAQRHQFKLGTTDLDGRNCEGTCIYPEVVATGESTFEKFRPTGRHKAAEDTRLERAMNQRRIRVRLLDLWDRGLRAIDRRVQIGAEH